MGNSMKKISILKYSSLLSIVTSSSFCEAKNVDSFKELVLQEYFVDKTLLIKSFIETKENIVLVTRPQGWGKSLNIDMLKEFFNVGVCEEMASPCNGQKNKALFEKLKIGNETTSIENIKTHTAENVRIVDHFLAQYPVVFLSLSGVQSKTYDSALEEIMKAISFAFNEHSYLYKNPDWEKTKKLFENNLSKASINDVTGSIKLLTQLLYEYHGKSSYVFIDSYDTPLHHPYFEGRFSEISQFIKCFYQEALVGNPYIKKSMLTGVIPFTRDSFFNGFNNLFEDTILQGQFQKYYGFTEEEISTLLSSSSDALQKFKEWYGGYYIDSLSVYVPDSIVQFIEQKNFTRYWIDTHLTELINNNFLRGKSLESLAVLRNDGVISKEVLSIDPFNLFIDPLEPREEEAFWSHSERISCSLISNGGCLKQRVFWSLLFHGGYLTKENPHSENGDETLTQVKIPNKEIKSLYGLYFSKWLQSAGYSVEESQTVLRTIEDTKKIYQAIVSKDVATVNSLLQKMRIKTDFSKNMWSSNFLHLAALVGNEEIFNALLKDYNHLLVSQDVQGLGVADYATLGGHSHFHHLKNIQPYFYKPDYAELLPCYPIRSLFGTTSTLLMFGKKGLDILRSDQGLLKRAYSFSKYSGMLMLVSQSINEILKIEMDSYCKNYDVYQSVNIADLVSSPTLRLFEKYIIENEGTYMTLGTSCNESSTIVTIIKKPLTNPNITPMNLFFTLCRNSQSSMERLADEF